MSQLVAERTLVHGRTVRILRGDITLEATDAIVNPANERLLLGGGVAGAIGRRGGPSIQQACDEYVRTHGPVPVGGAAATPAGELDCDYVIHAVGPVWTGGESGEEDRLQSALLASLVCADRLGLASISVPAISTGIFGYPLDRAAVTLVQGVLVFDRERSSSSVKLIQFVLFDDAAAGVFADVLRELP